MTEDRKSQLLKSFLEEFFDFNEMAKRLRPDLFGKLS